MSDARLELEAVLDEELAGWPGSAGIAVVGADGVLAARGTERAYPWASVTKLLAALTVLDLVHAGTVGLDEPAGPEGSTVRHLLAHASGLSRDSDRVVAAPGRRRVYSNRGVEVLAEHVESRTATSFTDLVQARVLDPVGMSGTVLDGLLPGFGQQRPNDWGLGFEVRAEKSPHWTSPLNAPATFGHFGQSGSFLWVDPSAGIACVSAGETPFGTWAMEAWPRLSTRVLVNARDARPTGS